MENDYKSQVAIPPYTDSQIENKRFTQYSEIKTLLIMSIGPFSLFIQTLGELVDMYQVGKRFNSDPDSHAVQILGFSTNIFLTIAFVGALFSHSLAVRVITLISTHQRDEAAQLVTDVYRASFFFSFVFFLFIFAVKPYLKLCGCPSELIQPAYEVIRPLVFSTWGTGWFQIGIAYFQCIGRPVLSALLKLLAYTIQCLFLTPFILFIIKASTEFIRLSEILSQSFLGFIIFFLIFKGRFNLKPTFSNLIRPFTPEFPRALALASPLAVQFLCLILPPILMLQTMSEAAGDKAEYVGGVFAVIARLNGITQSLPAILAMSFLNCGNYAYGQGDIKRLFKYYKWTLLLCFCVMIFFAPFMIFLPDKIASLFLDLPGEIAFASKMIPIPYYTSYLSCFAVASSQLLIILGKPLICVIGSFLQTIILCAGCKIINSKYKHPIKVLYIYNVADVIHLIYFIIFMIKPLKNLINSVKEENHDRERLYQSLNKDDSGN